MKYKVILTQSSEVAKMLTKAHAVGNDDVHSIAYGHVGHFPEVPEIYRETDAFVCVITYEDSACVSDYQLIIA